MKDQIFMSPINGELCVGVPLYQLTHDTVTMIPGLYSIAFVTEKPVAWGLDVGGHVSELINASWVRDHLICLGDL